MKMRVVLLSATEWDMEGQKGLSIYYLAEDSTRKDFPPLKASIDRDLLPLIDKRPGVYDVEMSLKSQGGKAVLLPSGFKFVKEVDIKGFLNDAGK